MVMIYVRGDERVDGSVGDNSKGKRIKAFDKQ